MKKLKYLSIVLIILNTNCKNSNNKIEKDPISHHKAIDIQKDYTMHVGEKSYLLSELKTKTPEFLRYLRNEIFARYGYVFSDTNLQTYFNNQNWYKQVNSVIKLDSNEQSWVDSLKYIEDNYNTISPLKIIAKFRFNNMPLYYIASDLRFPFEDDPNGHKYTDAHLYLLDSSYMWTMDCSTIPPEYIISHATQHLRCTDDGIAVISKQDFEIINFDANCIDGEDSELLVRLYGPSNDDGNYVIGFDSNNKLKLLVYGVFIQYYNTISDSIVRFVSIDRCDIIGTEFCNVEYDYNSITKTFVKTNAEWKEHTISLQTRGDSIFVYPTKSSARKEHQDSIKYIIPPYSRIKVTAFRYNSVFYRIVYKDSIGWIRAAYKRELGASFAD